MNVLNTVNPKSVVKAISKLKKLRSKDEVEDTPVVMTNEFAALLN